VVVEDKENLVKVTMIQIFVCLVLYSIVRKMSYFYITMPVWGRNTAKIYGVNTVDGRKYYGRQFASLRPW
jgi:hypothetical protein